jgi:hypothetical protein
MNTNQKFSPPSQTRERPRNSVGGTDARYLLGRNEPMTGKFGSRIGWCIAPRTCLCPLTSDTERKQVGNRTWFGVRPLKISRISHVANNFTRGGGGFRLAIAFVDEHSGRLAIPGTFVPYIAGYEHLRTPIVILPPFPRVTIHGLSENPKDHFWEIMGARIGGRVRP